MNKFFPLPILILAAILAAFLTLAYYTFAYAQQHDSPASARKLDADYPISLELPAYASEYFYFSMPNVGNCIPAITLSDSSELRIQLYDSREVSLKYAISSSHVITFHDSLSAGERYFLKISNGSCQDKKLKLTLYYTKKAKEDTDTKKSVKAKNTGKTAKTTNIQKSTRVKKSTKSKKTAKSKTSATIKNSTKAKSSIKIVNTPKPAKPKNSENLKPTTTPSQTDLSNPQKRSTAVHTPKAIATPKAKKTANLNTTNPNSKSDFLLFTHFLRIKAGTSLAIAEALNLSEESSSLSYRCIFSDRISIQNGILYSGSPGIAVIEITGDDFKSSCTICIQ